MTGMNRFRTILLAAGVLFVAAAIAGVAAPQFARTATPSTTTITVSGNGTANGVPDQASFDFGVSTQATTATEALSRNAEQANAIVAALKKAGIDASKIQTTDVSLWPQTTSNGTQIVGYTASNSVDVTVPIATAGDTVDAAVRAGANNVDGPNLSVTDQTSLYDEALKQALADARQKAQEIAAASGLTLGIVQKVTETGGQPTPVMVANAAVPTASPPIEAGTQQVQASVTVTYAAS
jgi:uncharacterized protein YggE